MIAAEMKLLLVEDEASLARSLGQGLREEGHQVDVCRTGAEALRQAKDIDYDAVVLDWMLPDLDGVTILRTWREQGLRTPVLMLTARGSVGERVTGGTIRRRTAERRWERKRTPAQAAARRQRRVSMSSRMASAFRRELFRATSVSARTSMQRSSSRGRKALTFVASSRARNGWNTPAFRAASSELAPLATATWYFAS